MEKLEWNQVLDEEMVSLVLCSDGLKFDADRLSPYWIMYTANIELEVSYEMFADKINVSETALCNGEEFFVLDGDYRIAYETLMPLGYNACKTFYETEAAALNLASSWSSEEL